MFLCVRFSGPAVALLAACLAAAPAQADTFGYSGQVETNTYRAGDVLARTAEPSAAACADTCASTEGCRAWSLTGPICELKPAMGGTSEASDAQSGLYFPGVGHLALRPANVEFEPAETPSVVPVYRDTQPASVEQVSAKTVSAASQPGTYAPRQVSSWSWPSSSTPIATQSGSSLDDNFFEQGLPPGTVEDEGIIYFDDDVEAEAFRELP